MSKDKLFAKLLFKKEQLQNEGVSFRVQIVRSSRRLSVFEVSFSFLLLMIASIIVPTLL